MARTARKTSAATVAATEAAADTEARSIGNIAAEVVAALPVTEPATEAGHGAEIFIPLNRLKKSPRNARKVPHSEAHIEALAASIAAKGMLQNLIVEPELDAAGQPTGFYYVTVGEGRRLAHLLRAKRKEIGKAEPIRCVLDSVNDPQEISLDENVTREAMHPADQFEAFRELAEQHGWGAEDIAARFGVTAHVVKQRLRLGAVSPKLLQVYRDGGLNLDQLTAFAITEDHARQERVYENLSYNRDPWIIRRDLTKGNVPATDRRAIFVGAEAYTEAGGVILRDLFSEDRGGYFEDAALLDRLAIAKLEGIAADIQEAEGWKWTSIHLDYPHGNGLRRAYPHPVELSDEDEAAFEVAQEAYESLSSQYESVEDLPDDVEARLGELQAEIERIAAMRRAYDPDDIVRGGIILAISYDGEVRIERGFIRPEDEKPEPEKTGSGNVDDGPIMAADDHDEDGNPVAGDAPVDEEAEDDSRPLSDALIRDLSAHRTLGLRLALGEQPDIALIAVTHALAAQTFYRGVDVHALEILPSSPHLASHAEGIEDTAAAKALADRHAGWAADMPSDVRELWDFIAGLDQASVMALFAHCASLTVNVLKLPWDSRQRAHATADKLATTLALDMTTHWTPTVRTYLGRVTKAHILAAVREALGDEAADRIAGLKKQAMAETAEQLLAGTGWLPPSLRTDPPARLNGTQPEAADIEPGTEPEMESGETFPAAAE
ncbi:ParB/RepB/Spo0J family partition protein [Pseudochelatococcus sp. B33]